MPGSCFIDLRISRAKFEMGYSILVEVPLLDNLGRNGVAVV